MQVVRAQNDVRFANRTPKGINQTLQSPFGREHLFGGQQVAWRFGLAHLSYRPAHKTAVCMFQIVKLGQRITRNQAFRVACIHARNKRVYGILFERIAQPSPNKLCHAFVCIRSNFSKRLGQYPQFVVPRKQRCLHTGLQPNGQSVETFALPNPSLLGLFARCKQLTAVWGKVGE